MGKEFKTLCEDKSIILDFYLYHFMLDESHYGSLNFCLKMMDTGGFRDSKKKHARYLLGLSEIDKRIRDLKILKIFLENFLIP